MSVSRRTPTILIALASTLVAAMVASLPAQATLIGDDVAISYELRNPGLFTGCGPTRNVTVAADASDAVSFCARTLLVDVNAESISLIYRDTFPVTAGDFNGLVIRDLDWVGSPGTITGLEITTNLVNWSDSFASFTGDSVSINFAEYSNIGSGQLTPFDMQIGLNTTHSVAEPGTLALLGFGLVALGLTRKRGHE